MVLSFGVSENSFLLHQNLFPMKKQLKKYTPFLRNLGKEITKIAPYYTSKGTKKVKGSDLSSQEIETAKEKDSIEILGHKQYTQTFPVENMANHYKRLKSQFEKGFKKGGTTEALNYVMMYANKFGKFELKSVENPEKEKNSIIVA